MRADGLAGPIRSSKLFGVRPAALPCRKQVLEHQSKPKQERLGAKGRSTGARPDQSQARQARRQARKARRQAWEAGAKSGKPSHGKLARAKPGKPGKTKAIDNCRAQRQARTPSPGKKTSIKPKKAREAQRRAKPGDRLRANPGWQEPGPRRDGPAQGGRPARPGPKESSKGNRSRNCMPDRTFLCSLKRM
jgi:hypothetical protein